MKHAGWFGESYRHSLSAHGIRTGNSHRYMGTKIDFAKKMLLPNKSSEEQRFDDIREGELREMVYARIRKEEASGNLTHDKADQMIEILDGELKMLRQGVSYGEVKHELARKVDNHVKMHSKAGMMPWSDKNEVEKSSDVHEHPGIMPYNNQRVPVYAKRKEDLSEERRILRSKRKDILDDARRAYGRGDIERADRLYGEAISLSDITPKLHDIHPKGRRKRMRVRIKSEEDVLPWEREPVYPVRESKFEKKKMIHSPEELEKAAEEFLKRGRRVRR
jgi:hypothetical protein